MYCLGKLLIIKRKSNGRENYCFWSGKEYIADQPLRVSGSIIEKCSAKVSIIGHGASTLSLVESSPYECSNLPTISNNLDIQITHLKGEISKLRLGHEMIDTRRRHITHSNPFSEESNSDKRKRVRRTANEIARHYECKVERCHKSYGSEGSLNQHIKLKHPELFNEFESIQFE